MTTLPYNAIIYTMNIVRLINIFLVFAFANIRCAIMYIWEAYMQDNGLIGIYILEILEKYASSKKRLFQKDIASYLDVNYNVTIGRTALSGYICLLRERGYIAGDRGVYKVSTFDDNELRLLIDGVLFGQHIPKKDAERLIGKLKGLSYKSMSNRVKHICYLEGTNHTPNGDLYNIIDTIDEAIESDYQIEFTYCSYGIDGKLRTGEKRVVHPYYMVTEKSRYYLLCYAERGDDLEPRRIDRMSNVCVIKKKRVPITDIAKYRNGFDLGKYMREHIYMFSGESSDVTIKLKSDKISDFIDWYGREYRIIKKNDEYMIVRIRANENATYYWALQYGGIAEVLEPISLRNRIRDGLTDMLKKYEITK